MKQKVITVLFKLVLKIVIHRCEEDVPNTTDYQCYGVGLRHLEIPCTRIGNVSELPYGLKYPLFCLFIDARIIIYRTRNSGNTHSADPGNVFYGDIFAHSYPLTAPAATPLMMYFW